MKNLPDFNWRGMIGFGVIMLFFVGCLYLFADGLRKADHEQKERERQERLVRELTIQKLQADLRKADE